VENQDGGFVGGLRSMDFCRSLFGTNKNVNKILGKPRSEEEEHNTIVSLRFNVVE